MADSKHIYLDAKAIENAEVIVRTGVVASISAAIRLSLAQAAGAIPRVSPTTY